MRSAHQVLIDSTECIGCNLCVKDCVQSNIVLVQEKAVIKSPKCLMCGHCVAICPKDAVRITGFPDEPRPLGDRHVLDPEELLHAIESRRSIRQFRSRPVEPQKIARILEAGRYTATGSNQQGVSYLIIGKKIEEIERMAVAFGRRVKGLLDLFTRRFHDFTIDDLFFFKGAPEVIVILSSSKVDGALAASNMELMAQAQGLGVLYSGFFTLAANHSAAVRRELGLNRKEKAVTTLVVGYPAVVYQRTAQREKVSARYV